MRNLASTMFATFALTICAPSLSLALPLTGGLDRAIAAAPASGRPLAIQDQPRPGRAYAHDKARRAYGYYQSPYHEAYGYPYYYPGLGYPYYYAGYYWPHYYGRFRYPGYDYSPFAFFGFSPSDFP